MRLLRLTIAGVLAVLFCGCGSSGSDDQPDTAEMVDSGSWYAHQRWPHDGNPVDSEHFVVYSDGAGVEARQEVADVAEDVSPELLDELAIDPRILQFPQGQDKLHIYAYRTYNPQDWEASAYYAGVIVWSPDNENRQTSGARLAAVMKHELVHVLQSLIAGPSPNPIDVWFLEGLPEALAGGRPAVRSGDVIS
ncbi:MAG: hypothetical protein OES24_13465 [Acidimicrobiia bacterium]|nr:hypothetical protein [Acidimicrobiia bacterium]